MEQALQIAGNARASSIALDGERPLNVWQLIRSDMDAWVNTWSGLKPWSAPPARLSTGLRFMWLYPGLRATTLYRIGHALHRGGVKVLPQLVAQLNAMLHGFDIPSRVAVGPRLYVPHPVGTVVMAERLGSDVTLVSNVTIGMRNERQFPAIGDRVYVGAGARILGGITVGDDVSVGANAVVLKDVPDNSLAVGVPARILAGTRRSV